MVMLSGRERVARVIVVGARWRVMDCPEGLPPGCDYQNDHADRVVWLRPGMSAARKLVVISVALECAASEAVSFLPLVG